MCTLVADPSRASRSPRENRRECAPRGERIAGSVRFLRLDGRQCAHCPRSRRAGVRTTPGFVAGPAPRATKGHPMCTSAANPSRLLRSLAREARPMCTLPARLSQTSRRERPKCAHWSQIRRAPWRAPRRKRFQCAHCPRVRRRLRRGHATDGVPMCTLAASPSRPAEGRATEEAPMCTLGAGSSRAPRSPRRNRGECAPRGERSAGSVRFLRRKWPQCAHWLRLRRARVRTTPESVAACWGRATGEAPMYTLPASPSRPRAQRKGPARSGGQAPGMRAAAARGHWPRATSSFSWTSCRSSWRSRPRACASCRR